MYLKTKLEYEEGDFEGLEEKIKEKLQVGKFLTDKEKERMKLELNIIKQTNTAHVFLLFVDTMYALNGFGAVFHGIMHCSYVCYLLGLTKVNPLRYDLPFERYYNEKRCVLPLLNIAVPKGQKESALRMQNYFEEIRA